MPIYRFQISSPLTTHAVLERIRMLSRKAPGLWQSLKELLSRRQESRRPFIGKVEGNDFWLHRAIRYRNSFLPRIHGHVDASAGGTKINVVMYLNPLVLAFMLFWFGGVGIGGIAVLEHGETTERLIVLGMLIFGVLLTVGGFYPEAIKARRLLEQHIGKTSLPDR